MQLRRIKLFNGLVSTAGVGVGALRRLIYGLALGGLVAGCSTGGLGDLPTSLGGLPANAPERPAQVAEYPAVHDMPPERAVKPLTDEEQIQLEKDLAAQRERMVGGKPAPAAAQKGGRAGTGGSRNP